MQAKGCRFLFMEQSDRVRGQSKGRTGIAIGDHVRRARVRLGIDLADLAARLTKLEWPIAKSALSRLENGQRRVDVDDLMALSVALYVSPLELLLGEFDDTVLPTAAPAGMIPDEIWAWASGDVELDHGELAEWWRARLSGLQMQHANQQAMLNKPPQMLGAGDASGRRWLLDQIRETQRQLTDATRRINELAGDGEAAGIMFDEIPPDPTVAVTFAGVDDGEHPEAPER